jgi:hypothetical protein
MDGERGCAWMSGPRDAGLRMPAAKWWLAISRDLLGKEYRRRSRLRPPAICHRTPTFLSPLSNR